MAIAFTAGLAAPAIFAALSMLGASSAVSVLSGGVLMTVFGATGAGLAGYKMAKRTSGLEEFELEQHEAKQKGAVMVMVGGWMEEAGDHRRPFGIMPENADIALRERVNRFYGMHAPERMECTDAEVEAWKQNPDLYIQKIKELVGKDPMDLELLTPAAMLPMLPEDQRTLLGLTLEMVMARKAEELTKAAQEEAARAEAAKKAEQEKSFFNRMQPFASKTSKSGEGTTSSEAGGVTQVDKTPVLTFQELLSLNEEDDAHCMQSFSGAKAGDRGSGGVKMDSKAMDSSENAEKLSGKEGAEGTEGTDVAPLLPTKAERVAPASQKSMLSSVNPMKLFSSKSSSSGAPTTSAPAPAPAVTEAETPAKADAGAEGSSAATEANAKESSGASGGSSSGSYFPSVSMPSVSVPSISVPNPFSSVFGSSGGSKSRRASEAEVPASEGDADQKAAEPAAAQKPPSSSASSSASTSTFSVSLPSVPNPISLFSSSSSKQPVATNDQSKEGSNAEVTSPPSSVKDTGSSDVVGESKLFGPTYW